MEKIHLFITLRGPVWCVRILIHGDRRIRWRAYRVADYPTPEAVARRCAEGLARRSDDQDHDDSDDEREQDVSQHGGPRIPQVSKEQKMEKAYRKRKATVVRRILRSTEPFY